MRIAIIGAGNVGSAVASAARRVGHDVVISATSADKAAKVAADTGAQAATSNVEAAQGADIVVLAVPWSAALAVVDEIAATVGPRVIIDATNPLKADYSGLAPGERSGAEVVQAHAPDAKVVKAFNTVFASRQGSPIVDDVALDGFIAGDDSAAKAQVSALLTAIGFRVVDAGPLAAALSLEHLAFLNISLNAANSWSWQSGWKLVGPTG